MKKLLTEFHELCKDGICLDLLTEREKKEVANGMLYLSGRIQTADKKNGNGRSYPFKVLKREIENYSNIIKDIATALPIPCAPPVINATFP